MTHVASTAAGGGARSVDREAAAAHGGSMTTPIAGSVPAEPPRWALDQAVEEVDEGQSIVDRAWQIVRANQQRDDERHDEYDDPDQGGEG
jgi:hypothetical protein